MRNVRRPGAAGSPPFAQYGDPVAPHVPRFPVLAILLALAAVGAGCGARQEPRDAAAATFPLTVRDASGATVTLQAPPSRFLALDAGSARTLLDLGATSVVSSSLSPGKVPAAAKKGAFDLIVASVDDDDGDVADVARVVGAPVYRFGVTAIPALPAAIAQLGNAIGRGPQGVAQATRARTGIAAVVAKVAARPRVRVLLDGGSFLAYGPETAQGKVVAFVGGANVVARTRQLKASDIRGLAPSLWMFLPGVKTSTRELQNVPGAAKVPAIAKSRYVRLDDLQLVTTPEVGDALDRLVGEVHGGSG